MQLALSNLAWEPQDEESALSLMKKYGFSGVEMAYTKPFKRIDWPVVAVQSLFYDMPKAQICWDKSACFERLYHARYGTETRGPAKLIIGSPKNRASGNLKEGAEFFRICAIADMPVCIEPNPVQYGCRFINTIAEAQVLIEMVNHPRFRLHLDSGIMTLNGETEIPNDIAHFHISQPYLAPVGPGTVDHIEMAKRLRDNGYQGWCSVEMLPSDNLEKSLEYVAGIYGD